MSQQIFQAIPTPVWVDIPYNAANFTAETGTWTVQAGDVNFLRYMVFGNTCWVRISLQDTANSNSTQRLFVTLPSNLISIGHSPYPGLVFTDGTGVHLLGWIEMGVGTNIVQLRRNNDTNFGAGGVVGVSVHFWFQLQA